MNKPIPPTAALHSSPTPALLGHDHTAWSHLSRNTSGRFWERKNIVPLGNVILCCHLEQIIYKLKVFFIMYFRERKRSSFMLGSISERILSLQITSHTLLLWQNKCRRSTVPIKAKCLLQEFWNLTWFLGKRVFLWPLNYGLFQRLSTLKCKF